MSKKYNRQKQPRQRVSISRWAKNNKQWLRDIELRAASQGGEWRRTPEYSRWRREVLKRDDYRCVRCGCKEYLEVHHIVPAAICEELRYDVRNGETLCRKHHEITPHKYDVKFWKRLISDE